MVVKDLDPPTDEVHAIAGSCEDLFCDLVPALLKSDRNGAQKVEKLQQHFRSWIDSFGIFAAPWESLDYHLETDPKTRTLIIQLLKMMERSLHNAIATLPLEARIPSIPSRTVDEQPETNPESPKSDLTSFIEGIKEAVYHLYRLKIVIQVPPTTDKISNNDYDLYKSEQKNFHLDRDFEQLALATVQDLYPKIKESLANQLARSIAIRRQRISNQRKDAVHQRQLEAQFSSLSIQNPFSISKESHSLESDIENVKGDIVSDDKARQFYLSGPTILKTEGRIINEDRPEEFYLSTPKKGKSEDNAHGRLPAIIHQTYSTAPEVCADDTYILCKWCCREVKIPEDLSEWEHEWSAHFERDLEAYPCISETCSDRLPFFTSRKRWVKHLDHLHTLHWAREIHKPEVWYCDFEQHDYLEFEDADQLREHLMASHGDEFSPSERNNLTRRNIISVSRGLAVCPICSEDLSKVDRREFNHAILTAHIAEHLRSLATLSLWRLDDDPKPAQRFPTAVQGKGEGPSHRKETLGQQSSPDSPLASVGISRDTKSEGNGRLSEASSIKASDVSLNSNDTGAVGRNIVIEESDGKKQLHEKQPQTGQPKDALTFRSLYSPSSHSVGRSAKRSHKRHVPKILWYSWFCRHCGFGPMSTKYDVFCSQPHCQQELDQYCEQDPVYEERRRN